MHGCHGCHLNLLRGVEIARVHTVRRCSARWQSGSNIRYVDGSLRQVHYSFDNNSSLSLSLEKALRSEGPKQPPAGPQAFTRFSRLRLTVGTYGSVRQINRKAQVKGNRASLSPWISLSGQRWVTMLPSLRRLHARTKQSSR